MTSLDSLEKLARSALLFTDLAHRTDKPLIMHHTQYKEWQKNWEAYVSAATPPVIIELIERLRKAEK